MKIKIEKPTEEKLKELKVKDWPIWEKEPSEFPWEYDETEVCYIIEGRVIVETEDGEKVEIKAGDLVTFPKGLKCRWKVLEKIVKHYNFPE